MPSTPGNALNITSAGIVTFDGTATFSSDTVTQYDVLVGGASNAISSVGPGSSGQVLQSGGNASNPAYSTATYPSTATGTGTILRANGTNWVATTSTYPNTNAVSTLLYASSANVMSALTTANNGALITDGSGVPSIGTVPVAAGGTGNTTATAFSLICGGTTTTGAFQGVSDVATGSVLVSGGTGALPAFSATPTVTSISFGGTALSTYSEGTFTPTYVGAVAGTTTYSAQNGYYTRVGNLVTIQYHVVFSAATGTGDVTLGGFPFTIKNQVGNPTGVAMYFTSKALPTSTTYIAINGNVNSLTAGVAAAGSSTAESNVQMANVSTTFNFTMAYQI